MAEAARKAALQDGQDAGTAVIYAEAKLGELLAAIPNKPKPDGSPRGTFGGSEKSLPTGISKRTSHQAQTLAKNPEKVEVANELYASRVANMTAGRKWPDSNSADLRNNISQPEAVRCGPFFYSFGLSFLSSSCP